MEKSTERYAIFCAVAARPERTTLLFGFTNTGLDDNDASKLCFAPLTLDASGVNDVNNVMIVALSTNVLRDTGPEISSARGCFTNAKDFEMKLGIKTRSITNFALNNIFTYE